MDIKALLGDGWKDDLTAAEIAALLEKVAPPQAGPPKADGDGEKAKLKAAFDKAASDLAEYKRKYNARLSEDEKKEAERLAKEQEMAEKLEALMKEKSVADMKAKYAALGYEEALAAKTAQAFADGDMETVFANQKLHLDATVKAAQSKALDDTPKPKGGAGGGGKTVTQADFLKMSSADAAKFAADNPEAFAAIGQGE